MSSAARSGSSLSILVADDHAIVREGLKRLLESAAGQWTVVEACSGLDALEHLRRGTFDVAVFDLSMPGMNGLELLSHVRASHPQMPVLILTMRAEEQIALRAFHAGARGFITKDSAGKELVAAVEKVASGGVYVSAPLAGRLVLHLREEEEPASAQRLSAREREVLRRLVAGERPGEIAQAMQLSVKTVSTHKSRIQDKLQLRSTAALVRFGLEQGLGPDGGTPEPDEPSPATGS